jgi:hypothetical protein
MKAEFQICFHLANSLFHVIAEKRKDLDSVDLKVDIASVTAAVLGSSPVTSSGAGSAAAGMSPAAGTKSKRSRRLALLEGMFGEDDDQGLGLNDFFFI